MLIVVIAFLIFLNLSEKSLLDKNLKNRNTTTEMNSIGMLK